MKRAYKCLVHLSVLVLVFYAGYNVGIEQTDTVATDNQPIVQELPIDTQKAEFISLEYTYDVEPLSLEDSYSLSNEEIDLIALVTMAEAEGECELGKRLVIDTILNRVDSEYFPDTVHEVIYQPNAFSSMWNGRVDKCSVQTDICTLVKEELLERTDSEVMFFNAYDYSIYGTPMFQIENHYFSKY